jgi:phenylalanyl-tRNA synthetase beta chain
MTCCLWWWRWTNETDPTFLPGHAAAIKLNLGGKNHTIGVFGILHPSVLGKFELP